jgi:hypothetical protein
LMSRGLTSVGSPQNSKRPDTWGCNAFACHSTQRTAGQSRGESSSRRRWRLRRVKPLPVDRNNLWAAQRRSRSRPWPAGRW